MEKRSSFKNEIKLTDLDLIRRFVEKELNFFGVNADAIYDILLAVTEVVTNVIVHGYQAESGAVEITVKPEKHSIIVAIKDWATTFNPLNLPEPDLNLPLEKRPLGGMGIFLIKESVDHVYHFRNPEGGNELVLVKEKVIDT